MQNNLGLWDYRLQFKFELHHWVIKLCDLEQVTYLNISGFPPENEDNSGSVLALSLDL